MKDFSSMNPDLCTRLALMGIRRNYPDVILTKCSWAEVTKSGTCIPEIYINLKVTSFIAEAVV